jgi:hypothetical protein
MGPKGLDMVVKEKFPPLIGFERSYAVSSLFL